MGGFNSPTYRPELTDKIDVPGISEIFRKKSLISGNEALSLGAIASGTRAYYAYDTCYIHIQIHGETATETGILVKQAENEITAVQMALGSMYMGTRALVAIRRRIWPNDWNYYMCWDNRNTLVIILSQRTGAATGVLWTGAGDLNTALKGGHGDFPRCILLQWYTLIIHINTESLQYIRKISTSGCINWKTTVESSIQLIHYQMI